MTERKTGAGTGAAGMPGAALKPLPNDHPEHGYKGFEALVAHRIGEIAGPVFTTDADPEKLWDAYLGGIPATYRQHYTCRCCRKFVERYWGLVRVSDVDGATVPVLGTLGDVIRAPEFFIASVTAMSALVRRAKVTGLYLWGPDETTWGTPQNFAHNEPGVVWTHLHGTPSAPPYRHALLTAAQRMAEVKEEYAMLSRGLAEFPAEAVAQAIRVLEHPDVPRSEKAMGVAKWLWELQRRLTDVKGDRRKNLVWLAAAVAPPGFCHVRSTMIGTLLEDVAAGLEFDAIKRRWADKVRPDAYQRPQAPPSLGTIKQAEQAFDKMNLGPALERRFALLSDVLKFEWRPRVALPDAAEKDAGKGGLFDHLKASAAPGKGRGAPVKEVSLPPQDVSWEKFRERVLPSAAGLELYVPGGAQPFYGLLTAVHPDAAPLLQWDGLVGYGVNHGIDNPNPLPRNPVSWYFYLQGSQAHEWGLTAGAWVRCNGVFLPPHQWQHGEKFAHQGEAVPFALEGCVDKNPNGPSLGLFPEILRNELHGVRSVIEAHSRSKQPDGRDEAGQANGIALQRGSGSRWTTSRLKPLTVRVKGPGGLQTYTLDRWE
jgi:hypothetical protein